MTTTPETRPAMPGVTEADRLRLVWEWIREPDWAETFTQSDLLKWIDRRPCRHVSALQAAAQLRAELGQDEPRSGRMAWHLKQAEARAAKAVEVLTKWQSASHIQLHAGEMTAEELQSVQAVVGAIGREVAALLAPDADPATDAARDEGGRD